MLSSFNYQVYILYVEGFLFNNFSKSDPTKKGFVSCQLCNVGATMLIKTISNVFESNKAFVPSESKLPFYVLLVH